MALGTLDFYDVFTSDFGSETTGGTEEIVTAQIRQADAADGQDGDSTELWGMGCALYRPADPDEDGKCQVLTAQVGPRKVAIASRDSRAKVFGALNKGDACYGSPTGGGMFRANGDGSVGFRKSGKDGAPDSWVHIEADGDIIIGNAAGQFELSKESGFLVALQDGTFMQLSAKTGFVASAPQANLAAGSIALGVGATKPLAILPGFSGVGFVASTPIANIFVA